MKRGWINSATWTVRVEADVASMPEGTGDAADLIYFVHLASQERQQNDDALHASL
jgi:hypothetical protein